MSWNGWPSPTGGSWAASPTKTRREGWRRVISARSVEDTIEASSMMTVSPCREPQVKRSPIQPSILWIVEASKPVASLMRAAAFPAKAARSTGWPAACRRVASSLMMVVLPVPSPPVMTVRPLAVALSMAASWFWSSIILFIVIYMFIYIIYLRFIIYCFIINYNVRYIFF